MRWNVLPLASAIQVSDIQCICASLGTSLYSSLSEKSLSNVHINVLCSVLSSLRTEGQIQALKAIACTVATKSETISWYMSVSMVLEDWN